MEDIFTLCKEGNFNSVKEWLENPENDLLQGDEHGFSPLHWACKEGVENIVDLLISRGAFINATNMGDDSPLHLACSHGYYPIVKKLLAHRADPNAVNEHGNTALHYACFWNYGDCAMELLNRGAYPHILNKYGETPIDKCKPILASNIIKKSQILGIDLAHKLPYKDQSWLGTKKRSRDATLSKNINLDIHQIGFDKQLCANKFDELWKGRWQNIAIVTRILRFPLKETTNKFITTSSGDRSPTKLPHNTISNAHTILTRISRAFNEEYPKLRVFSHPNILPVLAGANGIERNVNSITSPLYQNNNNNNVHLGLPENDFTDQSLVIVSQYLKLGSLYDILHGTRPCHFIDNNKRHHSSLVKRRNPFDTSNNDGQYYEGKPGYPLDSNSSSPYDDDEDDIIDGMINPPALNQQVILNIALDICRGMAYLHSLNPLISQFHLSSKTVLLDENLRAQINISASKFSFQDTDILQNVEWMSPESLKKKRETLNIQACDMWSFAVILWELLTKKIPFTNDVPLTNAQLGQRIALHNERVPLSEITCPHLSKLAAIAMNENPGKRPTFEMVIPIICKMIEKL